ncbi:MAG: hypothetical protein JST37_01165 [Bacteroidetes bacterium]|nr:hypothetical protein [Bacteroidota bacterium]
MKIKVILFTLALFCFKVSISQITNTTILSDLKSEISTADGSTDMILSNSGFNILMQKKTINYLTGVSDLSLAKFYAAYTTDNDKLNLGFNIPAKNPYTKRLAFIINPIIEADVKSNFATLYKDDKWKNNIRGGLKITYLFPWSTLNFYTGEKTSRVNDLKILRTKKYEELKKKLNQEDADKTAQVNLISGSQVTAATPDISQRRYKKKKNETFEEVGKAEAEYIDKEGAYSWLSTGWVSIWGFTPLSKTEQYITPDASQPFTKTKFNLWELNLQANYIFDHSKAGTIYLSTWVKRFQNNSANASLMQNVDYGQYSQLPGANPINLALIETNKAYIGTYSEFMTTNFNFQVAYIVPWRNTLIKPGLSFRYEKNWGDYSPTNLRFGLPFNIQGKDKPINVELQYRLNDINNFKKVATHEVSKSLGISLGFPVALLYK